MRSGSLYNYSTTVLDVLHTCILWTYSLFSVIKCSLLMSIYLWVWCLWNPPSSGIQIAPCQFTCCLQIDWGHLWRICTRRLLSIDVCSNHGDGILRWHHWNCYALVWCLDEWNRFGAPNRATSDCKLLKENKASFSYLVQLFTFSRYLGKQIFKLSCVSFTKVTLKIATGFVISKY